MSLFIRYPAALVAVLFFLAPWSSSYASVSVSGRPEVATISETASGVAQQTTLSGAISTSVNAHGVFTASGGGRTISNLSASLTPIQGLSAQVYSSPNAAINRVGAILRYALPEFSGQVSALMAKGKMLGHARQVIFTYTAAVKIAGIGNAAPTPGFVNETCFIAPNGKYSCLGANYNSNFSKIIYAVYQQGAVAQGLPASWTLPSPGVLQWSVLQVQAAGAGTTQSFVPVGGKIWHSINLLKMGGALGQYGLYDSYQVGKIGAQPVLFNCAAVTNAICSQYKPGAYVVDLATSQGAGSVGYAQTDPVNLLGKQRIAPLIQRYGASGGILLYGNTVAPVYIAGQNGNSVARTAINIQQRVILRGGRLFFIANGGGGRYKESGVYGFLLNQQIDQYTIAPSGAATFTTDFSRHSVSPTKSFSKSVTVSQGNYPVGPEIINPLPGGDQIYSYLNDNVNGLPASAYVHVAPIIYN